MKVLHSLCILTAFSVSGIAQDAPPPPPMGQGRQMPPYDASKEETYKAKVTNIAEQVRGQMTTIALTVTIDDKTFQVPTASVDFLKEKKVSFAKDDEITIKGVKQESPGGMTMIRAREITKGETTLELLDKDGRPIWRPAGGPGGPGGQRGGNR
ncbi:MAG: hypothetical protein FWG02_01970 [Holophagaceae bacterium]|nr:hypothetical protein [Holophagaceae bacterium]